MAETLLLFKCDEKGKVFDVDVKVAVNTFCKLLRLNDPDKPNLTICAVLKNLFHVNMYDPVLASLELPSELSRNECEFSELLTLSQKDGDEDVSSYFSTLIIFVYNNRPKHANVLMYLL